MTKIIMIAAHDLNFGIGKDNTLPWSCKEDMNHFKETTTGHVVIMGRNTADSFVAGYLRDRYNVVITSRMTGSPYRHEVTSPELALERAKQIAIERDCDIFVIGGSRTYEAFKDLYTDMIITEIPVIAEVDTYLPTFARRGEGFYLNGNKSKLIPWNGDHITIKHFERLNNV